MTGYQESVSSKLPSAFIPGSLGQISMLKGSLTLFDACGIMPRAANSGSGQEPPHDSGVLIAGVNWIGDTVMAMPAVQLFRERYPEVPITMLVKPGVADLWKMHDAPDRIIVLRPGNSGTLRSVVELRSKGFEQAYILPLSIRSALIPWLAGIPERIGMPGDFRNWMLNRLVDSGSKDQHQAFEYIDMLVPGHSVTKIPRPVISVPGDIAGKADRLLESLSEPRIGFLPGAARGPSKMWPAHHFISLGIRLTKETPGSIVVMGSPGERGLCESISNAIGPRAVNMAGDTSLSEWVALLGACDLVVANDSGGMHVAAATGTPVVALYGMTDPARTGPLGDDALVIQKGVARGRDIPRDSVEAVKSLESISPDEVFEAVHARLQSGHFSFRYCQKLNENG